MTNALRIGQRVTLLKIDDMMAMTHRYELEVRQVLEPTATGYEGCKQRVATVRQRGKRKEFYLDLEADDIVLDGWDMPFRTDTECEGVWAGNACFNLVGDPEAIRQHIETRAVFPVADTAKAKVIVSREPRTRCSDEGTGATVPRDRHPSRRREPDEGGRHLTPAPTPPLPRPGSGTAPAGDPVPSRQLAETS